jgi:hypothetical protein
LPKALGGVIPLAIPVRMGNDEQREGVFRHNPKSGETPQFARPEISVFQFAVSSSIAVTTYHASP